MFLRTSVVFRLLWEGQTALGDEEQLKLGSLTMIEFYDSVVDISHATVMVIGFTERSWTVSDSMAPPGADTFHLLLPLATLRRAERDHPMNFRQVSSSSAIVEPIGGVVNLSMMQYLAVETILMAPFTSSLSLRP